eukprot:gene8458-7534_t
MTLLPFGQVRHVKTSHRINSHIESKVCPPWGNVIIRQCKTINTEITTIKRVWQRNYNHAADACNR